MLVGTTPTHTFGMPCKASEVDKLRLVYSQDDSPLIVKTESDCTIEDNLIGVTLTQEDTFLFDSSKPIEIQLRILTTDKCVLGSIPKRVGVTNCLENEVII